ncbi:MAG: hypothetical protein JWP08_1511 [Bryobacterales bacterium]|nr:hypothetical protein [Bryobacterales bacterium]
MRKRIITLRHHGMRHVDEASVEVALDDTYGGTPSFIDEEIDTAQFAGDQDSVNWDFAHEEIWQRAQELRESFKQRPEARITYFPGYPEVAAVLAVGAYIGEEWHIEPFDLRSKKGWIWPRTDRTLTVAVNGLPATYEPMEGAVSICVEISAPILASHVAASVPERSSIATIRIRPDGRDPQYGDIVQSQADVDEVRRAVRESIAALLDNRPHITLCHVFVAAPPSVAFAVGQELRIRNGWPIQTYRHRSTSSGATMTPAMLLSASGPGEPERPLAQEDVERAAVLREELWTEAVRQLESYSAAKRQDRRTSEKWYERLLHRGDLTRIRPFPALPPIYDVIAELSAVDAIPLAPPDDYAYSRETWRVGDRLLLDLDDALGDHVELLQLFRVFMLHEASHKQHSLVKGKADEVGKFPNCLEHADYTSDLYAIIHELDRQSLTDASVLSDFRLLRQSVSDLIDLIIRSFWAFERIPPVSRIEVRRLRRHLNWYWQQARIQRCQSPLQVFAALARQPFVELAGLEQTVVSRRVYCSLTRYDSAVGLELGLILDNEELWRVKDSTTVPLARLVEAMNTRNHQEIQKLFGRIFEDVAGSKNGLPDVTTLP